jgi:hypothetical protein
LAGENAFYIEKILKENYLTILTTTAYLLDKAKQEKLEYERQKVRR